MTYLKDFKNLYRDFCTDTWGDAVEAWFECLGQMHERGIHIPKEWKYEPPKKGTPTEEDSYCHELFEDMTNGELVTTAKFITRYILLLKRKGLNEDAI